MKTKTESGGLMKRVAGRSRRYECKICGAKCRASKGGRGRDTCTGCELNHLYIENKELTNFINKHLQMTASDPRIEELNRAIAAQSSNEKAQ
jgi:hypothetical protein